MTTAESPSANLRPQIGTVTDGEAIKTSSGVTSGDAKLSGVMGWAETKTFLSKVVAWPVDDTGHVNLHYSMVDEKGGKDFVTGKPFQKMDQLLGYAEWAVRATNIKEIWYCTSLQTEAGTTKTGKPKAVRLHQNAKLLKAIWIDIDVKDDPKCYGSLEEAWHAFTKFQTTAALPTPSAVVKSGGGLHIYWLSDCPLTPEQWAPYAHGLRALLLTHGVKCDAGLTTDDVRLLRLPNTLNYKYDPPRPVELLPLPLVEYDFAVDLEFLATLAPVPKVATKIASAFAGKKPFASDETESLSAGLEREALPPIPVDVIAPGCAFIRNALETGGKEYTQPMWNLTTLAATFMEDGHALAHRMGQNHPEYTVDSTDELWARKNRERADRGLGWPSCNAIQANGCNACRTCPHSSKGKSPLALSSAYSASQADHRGSDGEWPNWPDPLDFHQVPVQEAIARVNAAGYFVLTLNGDVYKVEPDGGVTVQKREGFNNLFASRKARLDDGKLISAGDAWKRSPERREYDKIGYWPGGHGCPTKSYNLWQGWGIEPKEGDWKIIHGHILHVLACGDKGKADYIFDWCAHLVQRPWEKPGVALVFRGRKGTGKTLLTSILKAAVGSRNVLITASGKKLFGTFNWHLADKLLIGAEEAFFVGNHELTDQLKHLLTGDDIEVEQKFGQRISIKSMHRMIMTSNHDQVIYASDDERRFAVYDVSEARRGDDVYFDPLVAIIKGQDDVTLAAFMHELLTRDIKNWKPEQAAREAASIDLAQQKLLSLEPPLQWLLEETLNPKSMPTHEDTGDAPFREEKKKQMIFEYRDWVKESRVRGASEFTGEEIFWKSMKRLLNNEIFPGRKLFRSSGGTRFVILPPQHEMLEGFNRLLGGKVFDIDED